ncbi:MAG: multidrug transporter [Proteobacteria bacterium]|nr:multidrug transporter [Pseudomonadota bacterium]
MSKRVIYKSSDTGRIVSKQFADKNPRTTYKSTLKK